ncbi:MAG: hypothetical protein LBP64_00810 [Tannerella sp.]|jgi:hypothetical protein|nr:hypothetical protein [Tannerella sp.]
MKRTLHARLYAPTIVAALCAVYLLLACSGGGNAPADEEYRLGRIVFHGHPSVDGCGWRIVVNDTLYSPNNLDEDFEHNKLKVHIRFRILSPTSHCAGEITDVPLIEILDIKRRWFSTFREMWM